MRLGLGLGFSRGGGAAAFTPASLSPAAWYDPSDLATVWEDSARTTPASVNGVVGALDDKSGNGRHLTQGTAAAKPILRQSGALYWIETDGVDDYMDTAGVLIATQPNAVWLGVKPAEVGSTHYYDGTVTRQTLFNNVNFHAGGGVPNLGVGLTIGASVVVGVQVDGTATYARKDGVNTGAVDPGTGALTGLRLAAFSPGTGHKQGDFSGLVVVDRLLTAGEMANLDTYLAAKQGRVL